LPLSQQRLSLFKQRLFRPQSVLLDPAPPGPSFGGCIELPCEVVFFELLGQVSNSAIRVAEPAQDFYGSFSSEVLGRLRMLD
jgi:hypothetical protein